MLQLYEENIEDNRCNKAIDFCKPNININL